MYCARLRVAWPSLLTIVTMPRARYLTRYSGLDAILGLAFARSGVLYPCSERCSLARRVPLTGIGHVVERCCSGSLQKSRPRNSACRRHSWPRRTVRVVCMGKNIACRASSSPRGHALVWARVKILRFVFVHSLVLATLVGLLADAPGVVRRSRGDSVVGGAWRIIVVLSEARPACHRTKKQVLRCADDRLMASTASPAPRELVATRHSGKLRRVRDAIPHREKEIEVLHRAAHVPAGLISPTLV